MTRSIGVDVSLWQGKNGAPWFKIKRDAGDRMTFGLARVSLDTWVDPSWAKNAPKIEAAGLVSGGYHFLVAGNGAGQADVFFNNLGKNRIAVLDVERVPDPANDPHPLADDPQWGDVKDFVRQWRKRAGDRTLFIYTSKGYWMSPRFGNPDGASLGCPLWLAFYTLNHHDISTVDVSSVSFNTRLGGWRNAEIVQCGPFISNGVWYDGDVTDHTVEELQQFAGIKPAPPPPPPVIPLTERPNYLKYYNDLIDHVSAFTTAYVAPTGGPAVVLGGQDAKDDILAAIAALKITSPGA